MSPGWAIAAMSGGLPPSTAVESSGARLSPPDVYLTSTFGYCSLKPSITAWKFSCSSPRPDRHDRDRPADVLASPPLERPTAVVVAAATARGDECEGADDQREYEPSVPHSSSFPLFAPLPCLPFSVPVDAES